MDALLKSWRRSLGLLLALPSVAYAQQRDGATPLSAFCAGESAAGSAQERTLMALALFDSMPRSSMIRPLARQDVEELVRLNATSAVRSCARPWINPVVTLWYNANAANPDRDGPVWQGRGLTASISGGLSGRFGPLSAALQPIAYWTQNAAFAPEVPGADAGSPSASPYREVIDLPSRFGARAAARIEPGESYVRLAWGRAAAGVSTQVQHWGPAYFYPLMIGTEAPGFPRAFTELRGVRFWPGIMSASWQLGALRSSGYGPTAADAPRIASAFVGSFTPRWLPGLEVGASRFFHVRGVIDSAGWGTALLPFSGLVKTASSDATIGGYNQLAAVFVRIAPPQAGMELYGELLRDDHNADARDLVGEPDHASAYVLGLRRTWRRDRVVRTLTLERLDATASHLVRVRPQQVPYTHTAITEGHTHRGQPLGSLAAIGGRGLAIGWQEVRARAAAYGALEILDTSQNGEGRSPGTAYVLRGGVHRVTGGMLTHAWTRVRLAVGEIRGTHVTLGTSVTY